MSHTENESEIQHSEAVIKSLTTEVESLKVEQLGIGKQFSFFS